MDFIIHVAKIITIGGFDIWISETSWAARSSWGCTITCRGF